MARRKPGRLKFWAVVVMHTVVLLGIFMSRATPAFWGLVVLVFLEWVYFGNLWSKPPRLRDPAYDSRE